MTGFTPPTPHTHPEATLIAEIPALTREIWELAGGSGSSLGTGGMSTKLQAADICTQAGCDMVIANGSSPSVLYDIADGKPVGSRFRERKDKTAMNLPPPSGEMPCYPPPAFSGHEFSASAAADPTELTITRPLLEEALAAKPALAALSTEEKKAVLLSMADALEADTPAILAANALDLAAAQDTISPVMQDRLRLTQGRIADMAAGVRAVAALPRSGGADPGLPHPAQRAPGQQGLCPPGGSSPSSMSPGPMSPQMPPASPSRREASASCGAGRSPFTPTPPSCPPCTKL